MTRADDSVTAPVVGGLDSVLLDAQLRQAARRIAELEARDSLKTQFLANISHDLRTPLTAVITHAEILRVGILGPLTQRQLESIGGIIIVGRQILDKVGDILTAPRRATHHLAISATQIPLAEVVARSSSLIDP